MSTFGQIADAVSRIVKRGNSLDDSIPLAIATAGKWFERNNSHKYMEVHRITKLDPKATTPWVVETPTPIKRPRFVRVLCRGSDGSIEFARLRAVDGEELSRIDVGPPRAFWISGTQQINLNSIVSKPTELEMLYFGYSSWPLGITEEKDREFNNWLTEFGDDFLIWAAINELGTELRNDQLLARSRIKRDEALKTLENDNDNRMLEENRDIVMNDPRRIGADV